MKYLPVFFSFSIAVLLLNLYSCSSKGNFKEFNKGKVYFTQQVNENDVNKLGELLVESKIFDGSGGIFQLDYADSTYYIKAVVSKDRLEDIRFIRFSNLMRMLIRGKLFPNYKVIYQLCDNKFNVMKSIASEEDVVVGGDE